MAVDTGTLASATTKVHSSLVSLDETDDAGESQVSTTEGSTAAQSELEELRAQNARYKQQMSGWERQSGVNKQERDAMADRLARLEGRVEATTTGKVTPVKSQDGLPAGKLGSALRKWLDNDDSELNEVEEYLANAGKSRRHDEPDIEQVVTKTLQKFGTKSTLQSQIGRAHPEMGDEKSALYGAVFDQYDAYAGDPGNRLFFPEDESFMVPVPDPDSGRQKLMDARIIRQLAAELKAQGNLSQDHRQQRETRSAGFGTAQNGNGRVTGTQRNRNVEAIELLTQGERDEIANLKMMKAWPKSWPADEKGAAKMLYENLSASEKAKRLDGYRRTRS